MADPSLCEQLHNGIGELFVCSEQNGYQRIRTPYLYPDGDVIDLFCETRDDVLTISDLGETTRWLRMQSLSARRTAKQNALIEDVRLTHNVEFFKGMLLARCRRGEPLAPVVMRLAQAVLRVADLWFTFRNRSVESFSDEVADLLAERQLPFDRAVKNVGRSGRTWTVDFHVRAPARSSLVYVLSTGSRSAAKGVAEHVLAAWYDLSHLAVGAEAVRFVSLFDDTVDVWNDEDFRLLDKLSTVARWTEPDKFAELLTAA